MCKDGVNLTEVELSIHFMEDMAKLLANYIAEWQELVVRNNAEELLPGFEEAGELAMQLKKKLHRLQHQLADYEESMEEKVTITRIGGSNSTGI